jgi:hypothetical protein
LCLFFMIHLSIKMSESWVSMSEFKKEQFLGAFFIRILQEIVRCL